MEQMNMKYKVLFVFSLILLPITFGVIGYMSIEKATFLDALFMTITTVATVGYGEVFPLSNAGRIFTIILILTNLGVFAYALTLLSRFLVEGQFIIQLKKSRMKNKIAKLDKHVIVCGYGRNGHAACENLMKNNVPFVVIENQPLQFESDFTAHTMYYLEADATNDDALMNAGITRAMGLITTLPTDADNVYVTLTARGLNPNLTIVSRASSKTTYNKLKRAGADNVIMPDHIGGAHMASLITKPDIKEFIDILFGQSVADVQIEEVVFEKIKTVFSGSNLFDLAIRTQTGVTVIGLKKKDGTYLVNPELSLIPNPDDRLILLGSNLQMTKFKNLLADAH